MVCKQCGHDNPSENFYCGMCGTRLGVPGPVKKAEPVRAASVRSERTSSSSILGLDPGPVSSQNREPEVHSSITGPSFLGLGDADAGSSYLLDDDEESSRGHAGLWVFLVLLLAAVLFGLQFRDQVRQRGAQLYAAILTRAGLQPAPAPAPTPAQPSSSTPENLLTVKPSDTAKDSQSTSPANGDKVEQPKADESKPGKSDTGAPASQAADKTQRAAKDDTDSDAEVRPSQKKVEVARQRRTAAAVPEDNRMLRLAQRYLHGQGVARNCEQGMVYLRESLKRPTAAAASQMGALYATGTCVTQDRVSAYRWFNSALQLEPRNAFLVRERDEIYAQMSSAERRQIQ